MASGFGNKTNIEGREAFFPFSDLPLANLASWRLKSGFRLPASDFSYARCPKPS
jgi:hypothetical protein